jgi:hypothetical protein
MEKFIGTPSSAIPVRERPTQLGRGVGAGPPGTPGIVLLRVLTSVRVLKRILLVDSDNGGGVSLI